MTTADDERMPAQEETTANTNNKDDEQMEKWKAGDKIFAVWAGNGCYYGAVINDVQQSKRTMTVLWDDKETTHQNVSFDQVMEPNDDSKPWNKSRIDRKAIVTDTDTKGRCLFTTEACEPGAVVFIERPTLVALPASAPKLWEHLTKLHEAQPLNLGTVTFHYAALLSQLELDPMSIDVILDKFVPEPDEEPGEDVIRILQSLSDDMHPKLNLKENPMDPRRLQRLVSSWRYNSFGHHKEDGLVLYNRISMCSHSCDPSCCWSYGEEDSFVLRARVNLNANEELTISYLQDEDLLKSTVVRQAKLQNWRFTCACDRCALQTDMGRGFMCRKCQIGLIFATATNSFVPCSVCGTCPSEKDTTMLLHFEEEYVVRVENLDKNDVADVETVYQAALEIFNKHWILYVMDTYLWEAYREKKIQDAIEHQRRRIDYHEHYYFRPTFILAWCHEELGDCLQNQLPHRTWQYIQELQRAYHMLAILCGTSHQYTASPYNKIWQANNQKANANTNAVVDTPVTLAPGINAMVD